MGKSLGVDMEHAGRVTISSEARFSRRALLAFSALATLSLAACGDESSTRQFAGGPLTPGPDDTTYAVGLDDRSGSPTAQPTQMPVAELLAPRGIARFSVIAHQHRLTVADIESGDGHDIWSDSDRTIWAVASTPSGEQIAALTAPSMTANGWSIDFLDFEGASLGQVELGARQGTPSQRPDAVAAGRGGMTWIAGSASVAVALPSGGLQQVFVDGSQVKLLPASAAKRPAAVAVTSDAGTIAFVDQPSGSEGSGIYAGSMKAKPIDPLVILPADRSGNRYAHDLAWIDAGGRVATVIEREELGTPQGDLFYIDTGSGKPTLAWTSPSGREIWSVASFAIADDGAVVTFLTNANNPSTEKPSSVWLMQIDGNALERFELPVALEGSRLVFSPDGVAVSGVVRVGKDAVGPGAVYLITSTGEVIERYREARAATPAASPVASPPASPMATPEASPSPQAITSEV